MKPKKKNRKSILEQKKSLRHFGMGGGGGGGGLACDVLKFAFLHQVFHKQESF